MEKADDYYDDIKDAYSRFSRALGFPSYQFCSLAILPLFEKAEIDSVFGGTDICCKDDDYAGCFHRICRAMHEFFVTRYDKKRKVYVSIKDSGVVLENSDYKISLDNNNHVVYHFKKHFSDDRKARFFDKLGNDMSKVHNISYYLNLINELKEKQHEMFGTRLLFTRGSRDTVSRINSRLKLLIELKKRLKNGSRHGAVSNFIDATLKERGRDDETVISREISEAKRIVYNAKVNGIFPGLYEGKKISRAVRIFSCGEKMNARNFDTDRELFPSIVQLLIPLTSDE